MAATQKILFIVTLVFTIAVKLDAVSVNPSLCPTNKIAPHRREANWEPSRPRTLGLIYSVLAPSRPRPPPHNDLDELQEQPQEDDPDDCGEIEDYDETDLSSTVSAEKDYYDAGSAMDKEHFVTPGGYNKVYNNRKHRYLFGDNYIGSSYYPVPTRPQRPPRPPRPAQRPTTSHRPQRPVKAPTRPPFYSGGIFGSNFYRPPTHQYPSNHIKPVQEDTYDDPQIAYRPGLVGGTLAHVIGFPPVKPTLSDESVISAKKPSSPIRFPDSDSYNTRRPRAKPPNVATSIIGSFVDLLLN